MAGLTSRDIDELPAALTLALACRALNISSSKGYELVAAGEFPLPPLRVGGQWRFRLSDLRRYLGLDPTGSQHTDRTPALTGANSAGSGVPIPQEGG